MRRRLPTSLLQPGPRQCRARVALLGWIVLALAGAVFFTLEARALHAESIGAPAFHGVLLFAVVG